MLLPPGLRASPYVPMAVYSHQVIDMKKDIDAESCSENSDLNKEPATSIETSFHLADIGRVY